MYMIAGSEPQPINEETRPGLRRPRGRYLRERCNASMMAPSQGARNAVSIVLEQLKRAVADRRLRTVMPTNRKGRVRSPRAGTPL